MSNLTLLIWCFSLKDRCDGWVQPHSLAVSQPLLVMVPFGPKSREGHLHAGAESGQPPSTSSVRHIQQSSNLAYIEYALKCLVLLAQESLRWTLQSLGMQVILTTSSRPSTAVRLSVRCMQCLQARHRKGCEVWAGDGAQGQHGGAAEHQRHVQEGAERCRQARPSLPSAKAQGAAPHPKYLTKCFDPFWLTSCGGNLQVANRTSNCKSMTLTASCEGSIEGPVAFKSPGDCLLRAGRSWSQHLQQEGQKHSQHSDR